MCIRSEILWRVKEALAGRLTYDGGGKIDSALRANFDVINLVAPGPFYPGQPGGRSRQALAQQQSSGNSNGNLIRKRRYLLFGGMAGSNNSSMFTVS